jgi:nicotinate-nucleotide adenylyltransferase
MNTTKQNARKRIGIYGGSFNPILISHMMVAKDVLESKIIDELWMVPCGLRSDKHFEIDSPTRLKLLEMSLEKWMPKNLNVKVNDIELKENKQIPTYTLLTHFSKSAF